VLRVTLGGEVDTGIRAGAGQHGDLAAAMAEAALALKEPETVEQALSRLVDVALSIIRVQRSAAFQLPTVSR
jgi:hypothetical protein